MIIMAYVLCSTARDEISKSIINATVSLVSTCKSKPTCIRERSTQLADVNIKQLFNDFSPVSLTVKL